MHAAECGAGAHGDDVAGQGGELAHDVDLGPAFPGVVLAAAVGAGHQAALDAQDVELFPAAEQGVKDIAETMHGGQRGMPQEIQAIVLDQILDAGSVGTEQSHRVATAGAGLHPDDIGHDRSPGGCLWVDAALTASKYQK